MVCLYPLQDERFQDIKNKSVIEVNTLDFLLCSGSSVILSFVFETKDYMRQSLEPFTVIHRRNLSEICPNAKEIMLFFKIYFIFLIV